MVGTAELASNLRLGSGKQLKGLFLHELEAGLKGTTRGGYLRLVDSLNAQGKLDEDIFQAMASKFLELRREDDTPFLAKDVLSMLKYFNNFLDSGT